MKKKKNDTVEFKESLKVRIAKKAFYPMLDKYVKASYVVLVVHETKLHKNPLTSYDDYCKELNDTLKNGVE